MARNSGLGVLLGISNGIARIFRHDGTTMDVPQSRLPAGTNEGDDVRVDSSKRGFSRISPVGVRAKPSDSAPHDTAHDRQQFVMNRLIKHGWSAAQASGATGRFMVEAYDRLDTNARNPNDPGTSEGLGQWNRERKSALYSFAKKLGKSPSDLGVQVDFFDHEIRTSPLERRALIALQGSDTPDEAATAMLHYERPKGYRPGHPQGGALWGKTVRNANKVMAAYDPSFTPSVNTASSTPGSSATEGSGGGSPAMDDTLGDGGELLAGDTGLDTGLNAGPSEAAPTEEQTLGEAIGSAADAYGTPGQTVDTSGTAQTIQNMIQEGQQANAGALPRLPEPSFRDVFGEG